MVEFLAEKTRGQNSPRYEYANTLQTALFLCRDAAMTTLHAANHVFVPHAVANDSRLDLAAAADLRCATLWSTSHPARLAQAKRQIIWGDDNGRK